MKFPILVQHYIEHKEQNKELSLWAFLYMHYAKDDSNVPDYDEDMKLPFKSHSECSGLVLASTVPPPVVELIEPVFSEKSEFSFYTESGITSAVLSSIWQPPKTC